MQRLLPQKTSTEFLAPGEALCLEPRGREGPVQLPVYLHVSCLGVCLPTDYELLSTGNVLFCLPCTPLWRTRWALTRCQRVFILSPVLACDTCPMDAGMEVTVGFSGSRRRDLTALRPVNCMEGSRGPGPEARPGLSPPGQGPASQEGEP